ncbi:MAG: acetyl-CoA carboxylase carboxyltransferase subunit beta [Bauldia sp.]|nr:acetyl-CoA carboxylase carboxyltransferase subunit beta [Bauldia sp.]
MSWFNKIVPPGIRFGDRKKRDTPENLWVKIPETGEMVFHRDLVTNDFVVPGSGFHMRMTAAHRLRHFFDGGVWDNVALPDVPPDPLRFRDERRYTDRVRDARAKTGLEDSVAVGTGTVEELPMVAAVQDFDFMGGTLGMAAGEAVIKGLQTACHLRRPFVMFTASGGARMQEGILSLMQMPRTTIAVQQLREAGLPYIVVLTHPTFGGVTASYAMLGDIHIAEPGALIGFTGPRVIENTIREKLPEGFQRAEYLRDHGMVDLVVHRHQLRPTIARICRILMKVEAPAAAAPVPALADLSQETAPPESLPIAAE